jgi:NTE family protein
MASAHTRTAFVFAGGGSLGAIQVGALRELVRDGVQPDLLVGASVGALNATYFADHPDADGVAALESIWLGLSRRDVFPVTLRGAFRWFRGGDSLFQPHGLRRLLERHLTTPNLEDTTIPVHVVATSLSGAPVCISRGPVTDAVLASTAIPIVFPSVRIGDHYLMDGAIAGNTPVLTAAELGATRIVVLQTGYACSLEGPPMGAIARGVHALTLLISNQMERDLRLLAGKVDIHVVPHMCPLSVSPFDFSQSSALIERSAQTTRAWLDSGGLSRMTSPEAVAHVHGPMHSHGVAPAVGGYDVVSYFLARGPLPGSPELALEHGGATYRFASAENRDRFLESPESYLPRYGGFCAYAMARNARVMADPSSFEIVDGRLYLNLNAGIHEKWRQDRARYIREADAHWGA